MDLGLGLSISFVAAALVGLVLIVSYAVRRSLFSPRQWGVGLLCAVAWGIGGIVGSITAGDAWHEFVVHLPYAVDHIIYDHIGVQGYYSLALSPILAAVLGVAALYLLERYLPVPAAGAVASRSGIALEAAPVAASGLKPTTPETGLKPSGVASAGTYRVASPRALLSACVIPGLGWGAGWVLSLLIIQVTHNLDLGFLLGWLAGGLVSGLILFRDQKRVRWAAAAVLAAGWIIPVEVFSNITFQLNVFAQLLILFFSVGIATSLVVLYALRNVRSERSSEHSASPRWWLALPAGITWGLAGLLGVLLTRGAWELFLQKLSDGYAIYDIIYGQLGVVSYYSLSLAAILAGVLGSLALYLLVRYLPSRKVV